MTAPRPGARSGARPTALITGASRGIGRAIARRLAATYDVIAVARSADDLSTLGVAVDAPAGRVDTVVADVGSPDVGAALDAALHDRAVDVLVHNAGVGVLKPLLALTPDEWHRMIDVNVNALYHVTRAVLPGMVARERGHVVLVGSIAGRSAFVGGAAYAASKAFGMSFAESLLMEVRDAGVKVSVVSPGSVKTGFSGREQPSGDGPGTGPDWQLAPEDVAAAVAYAIATPPGVLVHRVEVRALSPKRARG
ncbi:MAG TPA: SDR family oxidoreductase [Gemmatirosa sp.]